MTSREQLNQQMMFMRQQLPGILVKCYTARGALDFQLN